MDPTESIRRERQNELNSDPSPREELEKKYGKCWDTSEMQDEFEPLGFLAPFIVVRRRADGKKGSLEFRHSPRLYFNWQED